MIQCDTHTIPVCSENQNNMENMQNKRYKIVGNTPERLTNKLIIREIELSAVVNLVYLAARDKYRVEREDKAGEGYVDFIFYPERKGADALILELKVDDTPENAIRQIREKNYALRFEGKVGEKPKYTGRILAAGISYSRKTREHSCRVERLR